MHLPVGSEDYSSHLSVGLVTTFPSLPFKSFLNQTSSAVSLSGNTAIT